MTQGVLLFDLDETLVAQERAFESAYRALGAHASRAAGVDAGSFATKIPAAADRALAKSPMAALVQRCRFGGRDLLWGDPGPNRGPSGLLVRHAQEFRHEVFNTLLRDFSVFRSTLAEELCVAFRRAMFEALDVFPDVVPCLRRLATCYRLAIVTNGMHRAQTQKLRHLGLHPFFEIVVASADVGVGKPDPSIFDAALRRMGATACDVWMVGDSLEGDIHGALVRGLNGAWVNRSGESSRGRPGAATPTVELSGLGDWTPGRVQ